MSVSPTAFVRALVAAALAEHDVRARLSIDEPDPDGVDETDEIHVQIYMLDGSRTRHEQSPEFDIAVYASRFRVAEQAADIIEQMLVRYPVRVQVGGRAAVLDRAFVSTATREVSWDVDPSITRFIGTYQLHTRS